MATSGDNLDNVLSAMESLRLAAIENSIYEIGAETDDVGCDNNTINEHPPALNEAMKEGTLAHDRNQKPRSLDVQPTGEEAAMQFKDFNLREDILSGLKTNGFHNPSPIQVNAIPMGQFGLDLIIQSKSGTGKTCAFSVVVLQQLNLPLEVGKIQAMILAPTREVAVQNEMVLKRIGSNMQGMKVKTFIGGTDVQQSIRRSMECNVVVGTPGRILHMIQDGHMDLSHVVIIVLDEADRLMESAFLADITSIFESLPAEKQVLAASATFPAELKDFVTRFMSDCRSEVKINNSPVLIAVDQYAADIFKILGKPNSTNSEEIFENKLKVILEIIKNLPYTQAIIFSKYIMQAEKIYNSLKEFGFDVTLLTGALNQHARISALFDIKNGKYRILVASDVASRGIDVEGVDLVINLELPTDISTYIHRTGRAGRFGSEGTTVSLVAFSTDYRKFSDFVKEYKFKVDILESPEHIRNLGNRHAEKLKCIRSKVHEITVNDPGNEHWKETLENLLDNPVSYPNLNLETLMGFQVAADLVKTY